MEPNEEEHMLGRRESGVLADAEVNIEWFICAWEMLLNREVFECLD